MGQAVRDILDMAKVGGFIIHQNPMAMINHGVYNLSPTFHIECDFVPETMTMVIAVARKEHARRSEWPMQSKYLKNPTLKS